MYVCNASRKVHRTHTAVNDDDDGIDVEIDIHDHDDERP